MRFKKRYAVLICILLLSVFICGVSFAQSAQQDVYFRKYDAPLMIKPFISRAFTLLSYQRKDSDEYSYIPNNPFNAGLGVSWRSFEISYSFGIDFMKEEDRLDTEASDFQIYYHGKNYILGGVYQKYGGFYLDGDSKYDRQDISIQRVLLTGDYVLNANFSSRAAFDQSEKQLKNAGSLMFGGGVYYSKIEADYLLDDKKSSVYDPQEYEIWQFGPSVGYGYTWVLKKDYFITGTLSCGINATFSTINGEKQRFMVFPVAVPKVAAGYNKENWGINLTFLAAINFIAEIDDDSLTLGSGKFFLNYIRRFGFTKNMADINENNHK